MNVAPGNLILTIILLNYPYLQFDTVIYKDKIFQHIFPLRSKEKNGTNSSLFILKFVSISEQYT